MGDNFFDTEFGVTLEGHLDIFLGAHGNYFGLQEKCRLMKDGANSFDDPEGYKHHIAQMERTSTPNRQSKRPPLHKDLA